MKIPSDLKRLGLTVWEIKAYLSLIARHPLNGSRLSRESGIPRARIYDVLGTMKTKGMVADLGNGLYAPLPPRELYRRLRQRFKADLEALQDRFTVRLPGCPGRVHPE